MENINDSLNFEDQLEELVIFQARKLLNQNNYTESILSTLPIAMIATDLDGKIRSFNNPAKNLLSLTTGKHLKDFFENDSSLQDKIINCLQNEESYSLISERIITKEKEENIVNIYLQPLYDDEKGIFGILMAIEDQTYISFLQESMLRYTLPQDNSEIVAEIVLTKKLVKQLKAFSEKEDAVLITGKSGTGKTFFASKLHKEYGLSPADPFIIIDCIEILDKDPSKSLFGNFNNESNKDGEIKFKTVDDYGAIHLADKGTLVLKNFEVLPLETQSLIQNFLMRDNTNFLKELNVRIIFTSSKSIEEIKKLSQGGSLANSIENSVIRVPTLRDRKKEIIPLARLFLRESKNGENKKFSADAENLLLSRHYSYNNVKELKEAVELGAEVSQDEIISSECIFIGPKEEASFLELNLTEFPFVKWFIKDVVLRNIRVIILAFFVAASVLSILYRDSDIGQVVNAFIWGVWWPGFVILLLAGRLWCTICPLSTAATLAKKIFSFNTKPPLWLKKFTYLIVPLGFAIIITIEQVFHMNVNPASAGIFLLSLIFLAITFSLIFDRETWCRYVCPLGGLGAIYSLGGILNVKANPEVCSSKCKTHECYKGSETQDGCPVFHHPLYAKEAHNCKLCFNCIKSCPHSSTKFSLQFPLIKIWKQKELPDTLKIFTLTVFFFAPLLILSKSFDEILFSTYFMIAATAAFVLAYCSSWVLSKYESTEIGVKGFLATRVTLALMIIAWGPLAAFQFAHVPLLNSLLIQSGTSSGLDIAYLSEGISIMKILQSATIIFAAIFGWIIILGINKQQTRAFKMTLIYLTIFVLYIILNTYMIIKL